VVLAASPHAIRSMLEDPSADEAALLGAFQWQRARVAVHRDAEYVSSDPMLIAAYNYVIGETDQPETRPTVTLYPRRLASLADAPDVFVTINPHRPLRNIIANRFFVPCLSRRGVDTPALAAQGTRTPGSPVAGCACRVEQALASGLDAAASCDAVGRSASSAPRIKHWLCRRGPQLAIFASIVRACSECVTARPFAAELGGSSSARARRGRHDLLTEGEAMKTAGALRHPLARGSLIGGCRSTADLRRWPMSRAPP
jgi:hypothetical protein